MIIMFNIHLPHNNTVCSVNKMVMLYQDFNLWLNF